MFVFQQAFSDLIGLRGSNNSISTANPFTVRRPIEEPPKAVQGQMLRMSRPRSRQRQGPTTPRPTTTTTPSTTSQVDVEFPRTSTTSVASRQKEFVSDEVLEAMLDMIESGVISSETVIEEMINNGILPVEVLEIGRLPITIGRKVMKVGIFLTAHFNANATLIIVASLYLPVASLAKGYLF